MASKIVLYDGHNKTYSAIIKYRAMDIYDSYFKFTRLTPNAIEKLGKPLDEVKSVLFNYSKTHKIIVCNSKAQFSALDMEIPNNVFDLHSHFYTFNNRSKEPIALHYLIEEFLFLCYT